jgi:hypothetical protein
VTVDGGDRKAAGACFHPLRCGVPFQLERCRLLFQILDQLLERVTIDDFAIDYEAGDAAGIPDVDGWVAIDDDDVGAAAGSD